MDQRDFPAWGIVSLTLHAILVCMGVKAFLLALVTVAFKLLMVPVLLLLLELGVKLEKMFDPQKEE